MKDECLICGAPLVYLENDQPMECALCHKKEHSKTRCCKRDSYLSIVKATVFVKEHLGVEMELGEIKCSHFAQNNQCIGERCPFK